MSMFRTRLGSMVVWGILLLALLSWGGFAYLTLFLEDKRAEYADLKAVSEEESERSESSARLRALVAGTEVERAAIESIAAVRIVDAAETIEKAVRDAGGREIEISEANAGAPNAQGISNVSIGVSAAGPFAALMRAIVLLESLPLPSSIEQFEIAKTEKEWRLVARLRLTLTAVQ
jgi:hypothetical protein